MNETSTKDKSAEPYTNDNSTETKDRSKAGSRMKQKRKAGITVKPSETTKKAFQELHSPQSEKIRPHENKEIGDKLENNAQKTDEEEEEKKKKYYGHILVAIILGVIIFEYYVCEYNEDGIAFDIFSFVVLFYALEFDCDDGDSSRRNPLILDEEYKRKRYCLICNAFKPERSHHCSVCNICVLNMDHHCPWVNNCIGFYNRKFFMQLLFYLNILLYYIVGTCSSDIITMITNIYKNRNSITYSFIASSSMIVIAFAIVLILTILNTLFFKFHVKLILSNITTIESLTPDFATKNKFNLSAKENWEQVFGTNKLLWFFPVISEKGMPKGDGLMWRTNSFVEDLTGNKSNSNQPDKSTYDEKNMPKTPSIIKNYFDSEVKKRNDKLAMNVDGTNKNQFQSQQSNNAVIENYYSTNFEPVRGSSNVEMFKFPQKFPGDDDPYSAKNVKSTKSIDKIEASTPKAQI